MKYVHARCYWQLVCISQKTRFYHFQSVYGCLSIHRHNASLCFYNRCLSQASLSNSKLLFIRTHVNLRNTIVYRDIKIYRSNVKIVVFSWKVEFCIRYAFRSVAWEPSNRSLPFFSAVQVHIGVPIYGLISIFIKCVMCQVVAQQVTYLTSGGYPNTWQEAVNFSSVSNNFQHYLCG